MKKNNLKKNLFWNSIGSFTNALISLVFLIIVTRINGKNEAGIFTFAFSIACLFQVIANYSGRIFQVTNNDKKITDSDFFYNRITTSIFMLFVVASFLLIKQYDWHKNIVIISFVIFRFFESINDFFYGVLQENDKLYKVGISLLIKGILGMIVFLIIDLITKNVVLSIVSIIVLYLTVFWIYDFKNVKYLVKIKGYIHRNNINLLKAGIYIFGATFLIQYILNAPKYAIDRMLTNDLQAIYGIVSMPATVIILASQLIIQPFLMKIKGIIAKNDFRTLRKLMVKISAFILIMGILGVLAAWIAGVPVLKLLYGLSIKKYLNVLLIIIAGSTIYSISFLISTVLVAYRKTFCQIVIFIVSSIIAVVVSNCMVKYYSVLGAGLSYFIVMCVLFILYFIYFVIYISKKRKSINEAKS